MSTRLAFAACALAAVAACAPLPNQRDPYARLLTPRAEVSKVIATELAFARAAREDGQWTAFAEYAADGALLFGPNGAVEAKPWLKTQVNPPEAVSWSPHRVWSSCDGSLAVTQGGFSDPNGSVGAFNTVWQRQRNGDYRYVFDFGVPQDEAPLAPDLISSSVAACDGEVGAGEPDSAIPLRVSRDGTLAWGFQTIGQGERRYVVWLAREEGWEQVVNVALAAGSAQ